MAAFIDICNLKSISETHTTVRAALCDGPAVSDGSDEIGSCTTFKSLSSTPLTENKWIFIGFTYDAYFKTGTFTVNKVYGFEDSEPNESQFFSFDSKFWLGTKTQGFGKSFRLGGKTNDYATNLKSFSGKMKCLQIHDVSLKPSQMFHQSSCPLPEDDDLVVKCPDGFTSFRDHCYKLSTKEDTFSNAEYSCIYNKGATSFLFYFST